ncbi:MAG: 2-oxoglutarate dehydrogenase E1 subunit family protein, partial [Cellulomonas sp.]
MSQKTEPDAIRSEFGANEWLVDELHEQYLKDKNSVDPAWWEFFEGYKSDGNGSTTTSAGTADGRPVVAAATTTTRPAPVV